MKNTFTVMLIVLATLVWGLAANAQTETLLLSFSSQRTGGYSSVAGVTFDSAGNLYGTAYFGGHGGCKDPTGKLTGCGVVFELSPQLGGGWSETVLHSFSGANGANPQGGVTSDASGNLYGTTYQGGLGGCKNVEGTVVGCGVVFELSPGQNGWTETVLHNFNNSGFHDGFTPYAGVVLDAAGNIYGTTLSGGTHQGGTVYELSPKLGGGWTETILEAFGGQSHPGNTPSAGLIFDAAGNLYGTTERGGADSSGTVFELSPNVGGGWSEKVLYNFDSHNFDGYSPYCTLILDAAGNLYGTTLGGGAAGGSGTVFELSPTLGGGWSETILHSFVYLGTDGEEPWAGVTMDASGNLYGTTIFGGTGCDTNIGCGTVYKLSPNGDGTWSESILHNFGATGDGSEPYSGLILDGSGNLYGTTRNGGASGYGSVFEIQNP